MPVFCDLLVLKYALFYYHYKSELITFRSDWAMEMFVFSKAD